MFNYLLSFLRYNDDYSHRREVVETFFLNVQFAYFIAGYGRTYFGLLFIFVHTGMNVSKFEILPLGLGPDRLA